MDADEPENETVIKNLVEFSDMLKTKIDAMNKAATPPPPPQPPAPPQAAPPVALGQPVNPPVPQAQGPIQQPIVPTPAAPGA